MFEVKLILRELRTVSRVGSGALFGQRTGGKPCRLRSLACDWGTRRGFIFRWGSRVRLSLSSKTETYTARGIRDAISGACLPQLPEPSRTTFFSRYTLGGVSPLYSKEPLMINARDAERQR